MAPTLGTIEEEQADKLPQGWITFSSLRTSSYPPWKRKQEFHLKQAQITGLLFSTSSSLKDQKTLQV